MASRLGLQDWLYQAKEESRIYVKGFEKPMRLNCEAQAICFIRGNMMSDGQPIDYVPMAK